MSWSVSATGTAEACKRILAGAKLYGSPAAEEQAIFDAAREKLFWMIDNGGCPPEHVDPNALLIFTVAAAGHGKRVSAMSFKYEFAWLK